MRRSSLVVLIVASGLALGGACSDDGGDAGSQANGAGEVTVDWENYSPSVKTRIDDFAAAGGCDGLQEEFDKADQNDEAQRNRVGEGNADLMEYIDAKIQSLDCDEAAGE